MKTKAETLKRLECLLAVVRLLPDDAQVYDANTDDQLHDEPPSVFLKSGTLDLFAEQNRLTIHEKIESSVLYRYVRINGTYVYEIDTSRSRSGD